MTHEPRGRVRAPGDENVTPHAARDDRTARLLEDRVTRVFRELPGAVAGHDEAIHQSRVAGRRLRVLVDAVDGNTAIARSESDAPEIDGIVRIARGGKLRAGEFADVEVTGSSEHDLDAKPVKTSN